MVSSDSAETFWSLTYRCSESELLERTSCSDASDILLFCSELDFLERVSTSDASGLLIICI